MGDIKKRLKDCLWMACNAVTDANLEAIGSNETMSLAKWEEIMVDTMISNGVTVQKWIPVTERLPQEDEPEATTCEQVKVLLDNGVVSTGWCNRYYKMWWHLNYGETHFIGYDYEHTPVVAWQPLSQPPKGE